MVENYWIYEQKFICGACIGSVATEPKYRRLGHTRNTIQNAENTAIKNKIDFIFLFSDQDELYQKLGYQRVGEEFFLLMGSQLSGKNLQIISSNKKNFIVQECIESFRNNTKNALKLWCFITKNSMNSQNLMSFIDFQKVLNIPDMSLWIAKKESEIVACSFLGKGHDFQSVIHTCYFIDNDAFFQILHTLQSKYSKKTLILFGEPSTLKMLNHAEWIKSSGFFAKILNKDINIRDIKNIFPLALLST